MLMRPPWDRMPLEIWANVMSGGRFLSMTWRLGNPSTHSFGFRYTAILVMAGWKLRLGHSPPRGVSTKGSGAPGEAKSQAAAVWPTAQVLPMTSVAGETSSSKRSDSLSLSPVSCDFVALPGISGAVNCRVALPGAYYRIQSVYHSSRDTSLILHSKTLKKLGYRLLPPAS